MTHTDLLRQALDALETLDEWLTNDGAPDSVLESASLKFEAAITALRAALAAPVEPVYWQWRRKCTPWSTEYIFNSQAHATSPDSEVRALYATPPAQPAIDGFGGNLDSAFDAAPAVREPQPSRPHKWQPFGIAFRCDSCGMVSQSGQENACTATGDSNG